MGNGVLVLPDAGFSSSCSMLSTDMEKAAPAWAHGWAGVEPGEIHPGQTVFLGQD